MSLMKVAKHGLMMTIIPQFLSNMDYTNCIRTEKGYCAIEWKEKTGATPGMMMMMVMMKRVGMVRI